MTILKKSSSSLAVLAVCSIGFLGCGGEDNPQIFEDIDKVESNIETSAAPTLENGQKVKEVVAQDQQSIYAFNAVSSSNNRNIALTMKQINNMLNEKIDLNYYSLNEIIDETEACDGGGTIHISASGDETNGGTTTVTFNNCQFMNGKILANLSHYNSLYDGYTNTDITYLTDFTIKAENINYKILKDSTTKVEILNIMGYGTASSMKMTIDAISQLNGIKTGQKNSIYFFNTSSYFPSIYQTAGRIYINNLTSYVDYDTSYDMSQTPFVFNGSGLESGQARYLMANGAKLKIVVENGQTVIYIDANGDGAYELNDLN